MEHLATACLNFTPWDGVNVFGHPFGRSPRFEVIVSGSSIITTTFRWYGLLGLDKVAVQVLILAALLDVGVDRLVRVLASLGRLLIGHCLSKISHDFFQLIS